MEFGRNYCCVGGAISCIGARGRSDSSASCLCFCHLTIIIQRRRKEYKRTSARFSILGRCAVLFLRKSDPGGLARPGFAVRRREAPPWNRTLPGETCRWHVEPKSEARQGKFLSQGAGGALGQKRSNGPADRPAGRARGEPGASCRGQVAPGSRGVGYADHMSPVRGHVSPRHYPVPLSFAVFWAVGAKIGETPDADTGSAGTCVWKTGKNEVPPGTAGTGGTNCPLCTGVCFARRDPGRGKSDTQVPGPAGAPRSGFPPRDTPPRDGSCWDRWPA